MLVSGEGRATRPRSSPAARRGAPSPVSLSIIRARNRQNQSSSTTEHPSPTPKYQVKIRARSATTRRVVACPSCDDSVGQLEAHSGGDAATGLSIRLADKSRPISAPPKVRATIKLDISRTSLKCPLSQYLKLCEEENRPDPTDAFTRGPAPTGVSSRGPSPTDWTSRGPSSTGFNPGGPSRKGPTPTGYCPRGPSPGGRLSLGRPSSGRVSVSSRRGLVVAAPDSGSRRALSAGARIIRARHHKPHLMVEGMPCDTGADSQTEFSFFSYPESVLSGQFQQHSHLAKSYIQIHQPLDVSRCGSPSRETHEGSGWDRFTTPEGQPRPGDMSRFDRYKNSHRPKHTHKEVKEYMDGIQKQLRMPYRGMFLLKNKTNTIDKDTQISAWLEEGEQFYEYDQSEHLSVKSDDGDDHEPRDPRCTCDQASVMSDYSVGGSRRQVKKVVCTVHLPCPDTDWQSLSGDEEQGVSGREANIDVTRTAKEPEHKHSRDDRVSSNKNMHLSDFEMVEVDTTSPKEPASPEPVAVTEPEPVSKAEVPPTPVIPGPGAPPLPGFKHRAASARALSRRSRFRMTGSADDSFSQNKTIQETKQEEEEAQFVYTFSMNEIIANLGEQKVREMANSASKAPEPSQQDIRFEIPMDVFVLEGISPQEYLRQFLFLSPRKSTHYYQVFSKYANRQSQIEYKKLERSLREVLINIIKPSDIEEMCEMADIKENSNIDLELFSGLAAMAERILYPKYLYSPSEKNKFDRTKMKLETADFCALEWKLNNVKVNEPVRKILESIL